MDLSSVLGLIQTALELGLICSATVLALYLSYTMLNVCDLSTDGCFTLGAVTGAVTAMAGHPVLAIFAAMGAGLASGLVVSVLQTRMGINSLLAGIIVNTALYSINIAIMDGASLLSLNKTQTVFTLMKAALADTPLAGLYKLLTALAAVALIVLFLTLFLRTRMGLARYGALVLHQPGSDDDDRPVYRGQLYGAVRLSARAVPEGGGYQHRAGHGHHRAGLAADRQHRPWPRRDPPACGGRGPGCGDLPVGLYRRAAAGHAGVHAEAGIGGHRRACDFDPIPQNAAAGPPAPHAEKGGLRHMLELKNISKTFNPGTVNEKCALHELSLSVPDGDFITIVGANGAGKSTLFGAISGSFLTDSGEILLDGQDVTLLPEYRRSKIIGRLFQDPMRGSAPGMTIEENLALAAGRSGWLGHISRRDRECFRAQLRELDMGLEDRLRQPVGLLSGGQRQALTLLMATIARPKLLLLDEHTAALDPGAAEKILAMTTRIAAEQKLTCLMVTHNMRAALALGNRTLMMNSGQIILDVSGEERAHMDVNDLLRRFRSGTGETLDNDRILLA